MKAPTGKEAESRSQTLLAQLYSELRDCSFLLRQLADVSFALTPNPSASQLLRDKETRIIQLASELKMLRVSAGIPAIARFDRWRARLSECDVRLRWQGVEAARGLENLRGEPAGAGAYNPPTRGGGSAGLWMNVRSAP
jgi:hypothetical protein